MKKNLGFKVSFLLMLVVVFSLVSLVSVRADSNVFSGITDIEIEENEQVNLLEGVSAFNQSGEELLLSVGAVTCNTGEPCAYDGVNMLTVGQAGAVYDIEYIACSSIDETERYTAYRKIVSVPMQNSVDEEEQIVPEQETQDILEDGNGEVLNQNTENIVDFALTDGMGTEAGLPIIFENGLHYVEDPKYPGERIILYCMNNKLAWPHSTGDHPNVPNYTEGYLTPDKFESQEKYNECIQKLRKLLFAGYPYNGERIYKIVSGSSLHTPTKQEFNEMLIVPPQLQTAFPYLGHHKYTLDDRNNKKHFEELRGFVGEVAQMYPDGVTASGLRYADIISMPFYKAANALTFNDFGATEGDVLVIFANLYSASYFVTEEQAYDATQLAVWRLLNEYNIENNDIQSLEHNELAKVLWQYCQHGALLDRAPSSNEISVTGDLEFSYNPKDGMWHSGKLRIVEPIEYNGLYHLLLPEGVTAICENLTYVYGNEEYELVSATHPEMGARFGIKADIDWLEDMKQYSPINSPEFQHMVGAVIRKTPVSIIVSYTSEKEGALEVSKTVVGNQQDKQKEFGFTLELAGAKLNGLYGDFEFHDGVASFTLKDGETKRAEHIPANTQYKITENNNEDYFVYSSNAEGTIITDQTIQVQFENTKLNDLLLSKTVQGEMGDKTKQFTFLIDVRKEDGMPLQGTYDYIGSVKGGYEHESQAPSNGKLTFVDGKAEVILSHGQQIQIKGIPFNCTYTVTEKEANQDGYTTTYNQSNSEASGTMDAYEEVHVVNTKEYVPATGLEDISGVGSAAWFCFAVAGLLLLIFFGLLRRKKD